MRLLFFLFFSSFVLFSCFTHGSVYIPVKENKLVSGKGMLTQDIPYDSKRGSVKFYSVQSHHTAAGSNWENLFFLPQRSDCDHYAGELVTCHFRISKKGGISLEYMKYTGEYDSVPQRVRAEIFTCLRVIMAPLGPSGALLESLILGNKSHLTEEDSLFRKAGVSHLLALSGLHRGIITLLFLILLRPFVPKNILVPLIIILLCGYTWLIGTKHSLLRAVIMYFFLMVTDLCKLKPSLMKILVISFIIQILLWPQSIHSLSLQLSYLAMVGIIILANPVRYILKRFIPDFLAIPFSLSFSAQLALFPLLIHVFGMVQLWGIVAGIILTPLITLFIWTGILCLPFLFLVPPIYGFIIRVLTGQYKIIMYTVRFFSKLTPVLREEPLSRLLIIFAFSVMVSGVILLLLKEGYLVRKCIKTEL